MEPMMRPFSNAEIVARARSRLGENMYDVLRNNCEHFCEWCVTGRKRSQQVRKWMSLPSRLLRMVLRWGVDALEVAALAASLCFYRSTLWDFARLTGASPVGTRWWADDIQARIYRRAFVQRHDMEVQVRFAPAPTHISNTRDRLYRRRGAGRRSAIGDNG